VCDPGGHAAVAVGGGGGAGEGGGGGVGGGGRSPQNSLFLEYMRYKKHHKRQLTVVGCVHLPTLYKQGNAQG